MNTIHESDDASARTPGRRRPTAPVIAAALAILLLALAWPAAAAWTRAQVHVVLAPNAMTCDNAEVSVSPSALDGDDLPVLITEAAPGMRCELRVRVENRGPAAVRLKRLEAAFLGPRTGFPARASGLNGYAVTPRATERDAKFDLPRDVQVESGGVLVLSVQVEFNPSGCGVVGGATWVTDQPVVALSSLGLPGVRHVVGSGYGFRLTRTLECQP